ncbi:MAG: hypothetical protein UIH27_08350 [Ruminococcus sp.]|nr:hypothetical protein [Ruminococcus sp.]
MCKQKCEATAAVRHDLHLGASANSVCEYWIVPNMATTYTGDNDTSLRSWRRTRQRLDSYEPDSSQALEELLNEYFRYRYQQEIIKKNPMANVEMIKKANFMSAQDKISLRRRPSRSFQRKKLKAIPHNSGVRIAQ